MGWGSVVEAVGWIAPPDAYLHRKLDAVLGEVRQALEAGHRVVIVLEVCRDRIGDPKYTVFLKCDS